MLLLLLLLLLSVGRLVVVFLVRGVVERGWWGGCGAGAAG